MQNKLSKFFSHDIGIDLGTANTLVYIKKKGIVINEPSVVAINQKTGKVLAIGENAKKMVGKTPAHIVAIRPLIDGVISDFEVTEQMLKFFIDKVHKKGFFSLLSRPRIVIGIPSSVTEVERKAVRDAAISAGAKEVYLIEEPMAAAIGARLPIQEAAGNMIVDIGGGTTDIAVISLGGIVVSKSLKIAGDEMNEGIIQYAREQFNILLGERTAESVKISIGSACDIGEELETQIRGRDLVTGLPREATVTGEQIREALRKSVKVIVDSTRATVEETPPELVADIMHRGIILTGGGSLLKGLDKIISQETKMPVKITEDPLTTVVRGTGIILEDLDSLREVLVDSE
jgi:rod shape-determining protein MreB